MDVSWIVKKAEFRRIDAFELWCWRRLLRVPWAAGRSNQSILREISPGCWLKYWCWGWNSNSLATLCEELTHWKRLWCWEGLGAGGEGDDRGWDGWMASPTRWTWVWINSWSWWWTGRPGVLQFMGSQRVRQNWVTELNWTELNPVTDSLKKYRPTSGTYPGKLAAWRGNECFPKTSRTCNKETEEGVGWSSISQILQINNFSSHGDN